MAQKAPKLLFIGAGAIAQSIMKGIIRAEPSSFKQMLAIAPTLKNLQTIESTLGCSTSLLKDMSREKLHQFAPDYAFLCVKPQVLRESTCENNPLNCLIRTLPEHCLALSLAAGTKRSFLEKSFGLADKQLVRVMLNTAAEVRSTSVFYHASHELEDEKLQSMINLFRLISQTVVRLSSEENMASACGVCGSGIAFFYEMIQSVSDIAVKNGLTRSDATSVAAQLSKAAGEMILEKKNHPYELRDQVTSPAGTTIYGLDKWHENSINHKIGLAFQASIDRAKDLG